MPASPMLLLIIGIALLLIGFAMSLRLRKQGGTRVMSGPWLVAVITGSLGGSLIAITVLNQFLEA
ncbi:hypothetical protein ACFDTO_08275 [Microbacteriaceae bacterium 4G12]